MGYLHGQRDNSSGIYTPISIASYWQAVLYRVSVYVSTLGFLHLPN